MTMAICSHSNDDQEPDKFGFRSVSSKSLYGAQKASLRRKKSLFDCPSPSVSLTNQRGTR